MVLSGMMLLFYWMIKPEAFIMNNLVLFILLVITLISMFHYYLKPCGFEQPPTTDEDMKLGWQFFN